jgi:hypothetical protein
MPDARLSRRNWLWWLAGAVGIPGCGTIFYPERRGQPAGRLDWMIVALDGVGLLFFFVPGVIAFAVDFMTGAIYLPQEGYGEGATVGRERRLVSRRLPSGAASIAAVEQSVSDHLQRPFQLTPGTYETCELEEIDDFWSRHDEFAGQSIPAGFR